MVGKIGSGRPAGFKHSDEVKQRMADAKRGKTHTNETKQKMSESKQGRRYGPLHRDNISQAKLRFGMEEKCIRRLEDLKANYPEQEDFFLDNEEELLIAMCDVRTEKELTDIRRYVETAALRPDEPYQYESSSCYAAEDAMLDLLDGKRRLQKILLSTTPF